MAVREGIVVQGKPFVKNLIKNRQTEVQVFLTEAKVLKLGIKWIYFAQLATLGSFEHFNVLYGIG